MPEFVTIETIKRYRKVAETKEFKLSEIRRDPEAQFAEIFTEINGKLNWLLKKGAEEFEIKLKNIRDTEVNPNGDVVYFRILASKS